MLGWLDWGNKMDELLITLFKLFDKHVLLGYYHKLVEKELKEHERINSKPTHPGLNSTYEEDMAYHKAYWRWWTPD